jgi:hypothetical protein
MNTIIYSPKPPIYLHTSNANTPTKPWPRWTRHFPNVTQADVQASRDFGQPLIVKLWLSTLATTVASTVGCVLAEVVASKLSHAPFKLKRALFIGSLVGVASGLDKYWKERDKTVTKLGAFFMGRTNLATIWSTSSNQNPDLKQRLGIHVQ